MNGKSPPSPKDLNNWVSDRSVALLLSPQEGYLYVGSAVPIELCGRYFLATAAHNLDGISKREQIRALPGGRRLEGPLYILEWNHALNGAAGKLDVAWLEVESISGGASSVSFVPADHLLCGITHREETVFFVHGYPDESVDKEDVVEEVQLLGSVGLATFSLPPDSSALPFQHGIDFLVQWPPPDLGAHEEKLPKPRGVSGGGLWLLPRYSEKPSWTYSDLRLVAISRGWRRESRQLVTTRLEHWLRLLAADRPYTRKEIDPLLEAMAT